MNEILKWGAFVERGVHVMASASVGHWTGAKLLYGGVFDLHAGKGIALNGHLLGDH